MSTITALRHALRLRQDAVAAARRELAAATAAEQAAADILTARAVAIRNEIALASHPDTEDAAVEALGPWLRAARDAVAQAETALAAATAVTVRARAVLAAARSAEESVAALIAAREAETAANRLGAERQMLAEAALRRPAGPRRGR